MRKKPNIKYTTMCMYIDEHIYTDDYDPNLVFEYLQMLFYALASKKKFFKTEKDYDNFSLFSATNLYLRLTNKNQFLDESDPKWIPKIKSVLNYIKRTIYPSKINYQQEFYNKIITDGIQGDNLSENISTDLQAKISETSNQLLQIEMVDYLSSIPKVIKKFLKETPYSNDRRIIHNIYVSCLITVLRSVTLSNRNYDRLIRRSDDYMKDNVETLLTDMMIDEKATSAVSWNLSEGMEDYIFVLSNKIQKLIIKDVRALIQSYEMPEDMVKDILMNPLSELNEDNDD